MNNIAAGYSSSHLNFAASKYLIESLSFAFVVSFCLFWKWVLQVRRRTNRRMLSSRQLNARPKWEQSHGVMKQPPSLLISSRPMLFCGQWRSRNTWPGKTSAMTCGLKLERSWIIQVCGLNICMFAVRMKLNEYIPLYWTCICHNYHNYDSRQNYFTTGYRVTDWLILWIEEIN